MSATSFPDHVENLHTVWRRTTADPRVVSHTLHVDQRSQLRGYVSAHLELADGSEFFLREFVDVNAAEPRIMYAYHFQDRAGRLIFRYDNALHRPPLSQPDHKHTEDTVITGLTPAIQQVLDEVFDFLDRLTR